MTKASLSGKIPRQVISVTLTRTQMYLGLFAQTIVILTAVTAFAFWVGRVFVHSEFERALDTFHNQAQPAITQLVDLKIQEHEIRVERAYDDARVTIMARLSALETATSLNEQRLRRIEEKLDRLLERR